MENKSHPWELIGKITVIVLVLFAGIVVPGFTFAFEIVSVGVFALDGNKRTLSEEAGGVRRIPEMVYLVPRSLYGMRQHELQKSIIKAVFYAAITILGYGITIGYASGITLDRGMLLLLALIFIYQIMMFYHYYLYQLLVIYQNIRLRHTGILLAYLVAGILLAGLCHYQFTGYPVAAFMKNPLWRMTGTAAVIGILMIMFLQIRKGLKKLVISDYR